MEKLYDANKIQGVYTSTVKAVDWNSITDELCLLKAGVIVTHHCTLKCKLCAERTAYYKERYHPSLEYLKKEIDAYFDLVDYTMKFEVTGGEPLMRKDLPDFLLYMLQYKVKFGRIRIITNGTILFNNELIEALKLFGKQADVLIDNYGDNLSIHAKHNADLLAANGIIHILRDQSSLDHFGGWVDFGDLTLKHTMDEAKTLYKKCAISQKIGFCFRMKGGLLSPCPMTLQCIEFNVQKGNPDEYLDLFDSSLSRHQQCKKMQYIYESSTLSACMYCNGLCEDSVRYKPAEQIERMDL